VPDRIGPYYYYSRTEEGKQYSILARKRGSLNAREEVILDLNQMAEGKRYFGLGAYSISPDHRLVAFSVDTTGAEHFTIMVKNLETGEILPDRIEDVSFGATWAADNRTLFYTRTDEAQRPDRVFRHTLGTDPATDVLVYHEPDVLFRVGISRTKDDRYMVLSTGSYTSSEVRVAPADRPTEFRLVAARERDHIYSVRSASATSATARSTPSSSPSRCTPPRREATPSTTPAPFASGSPRWSRRRRCTTTT
jgi:oligopeptidase B